MTNRLNLSLFCIDFRFDYFTTEYFDSIGQRDNYFAVTTAGSSLCLGYTDYVNKICNCKQIENKCCLGKNCSSNDWTNPYNYDMELLKKSVTKNIEIALQVREFDSVYIINHQDCGAFKAYLSCSGYPNVLGENNALEIKINTEMLLFAQEYIKTNFPNIINIRLGLIDINGSIADYNFKYNTWELQYRGPGTNPLGLWFGL
jgi:hypothetical protein